MWKFNTISVRWSSSLCIVACWSQGDVSLLIHPQLRNGNKAGAAGSYQSLYLSYLRHLGSIPCAQPARPHSHLLADPAGSPRLSWEDSDRSFWRAWGDIEAKITAQQRRCIKSASFVTDICSVCVREELGSTRSAHKERYSCLVASLSLCAKWGYMQ